MTPIDVNGTEHALTIVLVLIGLAALSRTFRVQTGAVLFVFALAGATKFTGLETGVSLLDSLVMQPLFLELSLLFVALQGLSRQLGRHLKELPGAAQQAVRSTAATALVCTLITPLLTPVRNSTLLIDDTIDTKTPADRAALHAWYRSALGLAWPLGILLPVIWLTFDGAEQATILVRNILPIVLLIVLAGLPLLLTVEHVRIPSRSSYMPLARPLAAALVAGVALVFGGFRGILVSVTALWLLFWIFDKTDRGEWRERLKELEWTRWFLLAAGITAWTGLFGELTINHIGTPLTDILIDHVRNTDRLTWGLPLTGALVGWISASPAFSVILLLPFLTILPNGHLLLPVLGACHLGAVLSPEHLLRARLHDRPSPSTGRIFLRLALPGVLTVIGLYLLT